MSRARDIANLQSGNVGFGVSPNAPLAILSTSSSYEGLELVTPASDGSGEFHIGVHQSGSSSGRGIEFRRGGSDGMDTLSMAIDASGNVGVGTSSIPSANSAYLTVGTQDYAISHNGFSKNSYFDGSSYKAVTNAAGKLIQMGDDIIFYHSPTVSAGAAQTQEALMVLKGGGNVGIGTTGPSYKLHQHESTSGENYHLFTNSTTGTTTSDGFRIGIDSNENALIWHREANSILFATSNDQKMEIDSSGRVGIGITPDTSSTGKILQINRSVINDDDNGFVHFTQNAYYNNAWKYVENGTAEKISFNGGSIIFDTASSNSGGADASLSWSERLRIEADGDLNVKTGNVIIETLGKGINFAGPTAQSGSVSQILDAYEEGTWEPDLRGTSSNPTCTYHADTGGFYIKIGRMVYLTGSVRITAISGGSGGAVIGGLPFTIASRSNGDNADGANACRVPIWNGTSSAVPTIVHMRTGTALLNIMSTRHDSTSFTLQVSDWGSTCMMAFSCVIYTA